MSQRILSGMAVTALVLGLAACNGGGDGAVTTPPPEIDIGQSDDGGAEPSDGGAGGGGAAEPSDGGAGGGGAAEPSDGGGAESSDGGGADDGSTEAAPDIPAPDPADYPGMDEETPEGAEQAFKYFWAVVLWGHQTGEADEMAELISEECNSCESMVEDVETIGASGAYWSDAGHDEVSIEVDSEWDDYDAVVTYSFTLDKHVEPSADGGEPVEIPKQGVTAVGALDWKDGSWRVADLSTEISEIGG